MVNGLKFPSRLLATNHQGHWNEAAAVLWMTVEACREPQNFPRRDHEVAPQGKTKCCGVDRREKLMAEPRVVRTGNRHRWVRRAASGERVKRGQGTRHNDPVTSEEGMPGFRKASRPKKIRSQRIGPSDCLAKTQVCAKPHKAPYTH